MTFEVKSTTSFQATDDNGNGQLYTLPKHISTWQVIEFGAILADFMDASSEAGSALINAALSLAQTGDIAEAGKLLSDHESAGGFAFSVKMMSGLKDVIRYAAKDDLLARLQATMFLKPNEMALDAEQLQERIVLFRQAPIYLLGGAVKDFLSRRMEQLKDSPSASRIFEIVKSFQSVKKPTTESSVNTEMSNTISDGTEDSSTSLPKEILDASEASSIVPLNEAQKS